MIGLLLPTLVATLAGVVMGGTLSRCLRAPIIWWPTLVAIFALELVLYNPPVNQQAWALAAGPWIWLASKLVMLVVLARNAQHNPGQRAAWLAILLGVALNTLAVAANGGHMPQSPEAAAAVWGSEYVRPDTYSKHLENVTWMNPSTTLPWISDILPEPRWLPRANVMSIGDVILALGVAAWMFIVVRPTTPLASWRTRWAGRRIANVAAEQ
jgi:hypothetical protein